MNAEIYFNEDCGVIIFPEFLFNDSVYLVGKNFNCSYLFKPMKQSLAPYILFDIPKDHSCLCLKDIFENKPIIQFTTYNNINEWVLYMCSFCSTIEFDLSTLKHYLSSYLKNVLVIGNYYYSQNYKLRIGGITELYYLIKWINFLGLDVDFKIQQTELKRKLGWKNQ